MKNYAILRLLLAAFFLYVAWPYFPYAVTTLEQVFWGSWLVFLFLVIGANLATLLQMTKPPVMEQKELTSRQVDMH
ncbi:hypothetical protein NSA56_07285 [Oceanobacillus caeni]|uniref:Uncharacterized protein n=1 Tax=Oceanobacillus caeni TaxID=405946 RepID=A0ABR5ML86_9BACI|nr:MULTISPECIES: hypothetical protein [Bacillaceae]KKE79059.1 hypothetical protein WH51_09430 [Bacilli bacterium VT-13-104]PZD86250.1 hypothetical protein DEJ64_07930 [Bacilli bacterium]KPH76747.1 hypothetical protein AFL42_04860 [Oceanobacillus caeni]MBU8789637.1 hypothetical protein [Oceanobacillus caeni]MCR1834198.1 hypothetical protein [Oceanobacillus caeni]